MPLSYDFDIHWLIPRDASSDPTIARMMGEVGIKQDARANYVALFRDPRTVEALRGADEKVRGWLEKSGFGFDTHDSRAGAGRYPATDEAARLDVIERLSRSMKGAGIKDANFNGFHLPTFLKAMVEAKPVGPAAPAARKAAPPRRKPEPARAPAGVVTLAGAPAGPVSSIDAAFANPKAGAPVPRPEGKEPTVEDLMTDPSIFGRTLDPVAPDGLHLPQEDLSYRPTPLPSDGRRPGMPMLPMMMVGAVVVIFVVFHVLGDGGLTSLVTR
jgi:hypothetical protein